VSTHSCASCVHAKPVDQRKMDGYEDGIGAEMLSGWRWCAKLNENTLVSDPEQAGAWSEGGFRGQVLVKPTFGCVLWEAK